MALDHAAGREPCSGHIEMPVVPRTITTYQASFPGVTVKRSVRCMRRAVKPFRPGTASTGRVSGSTL
jgi:hypothetical protein